ncbi:peptidase associated/transthyretin-like domain-containing protein [Tenacibaculum amylolyticum]|uniref:hypothetical protein n=1 Tax=Tenacibaculum amylolyticum TaxID=104269 RepID=UPI00389412BA
MNKITLLLFLFLTTCIFAQRISITGTLSDKLGKVVNAHIVNTTNQQGTFSDDEGNFSIKVQLNDVLEITSVQHHTQKITIANIIIKHKKLTVYLHLKDYLLNEVEVKKTDLSGTLTTDAAEIKKSKREEVMENLGLNPFAKKLSPIERKIHTATDGGLFKYYVFAATLSVDNIINAVSGRTKKLKNEKKLLDNETKLKAIENTYSDYINNDLKIDANDISRFIYFAHFDKGFEEAYTNGDIAIIKFLKQQALLFKKDTVK